MTDKRIALIENGRVFNVIIVATGQPVPEGGQVLPAGSPVGPGWGFSDGEFSPPEPVAPVGPIRVAKADFQRLLRAPERYEINTRAAEIKLLTIEERRSGDPGVLLLLALEDVLLAFERPLEFIELDHPETAQGLQLLAYLDVIAPERIAEIIGNRPPV